MNSKSRIISTDENPSLRIESSAIINLRGFSTKLNKYYLQLFIVVLPCINKVTCDKFISLVVLGSEFPIV